MVAKNTVIQDGQTYYPGQEIWDLGSIKAVSGLSGSIRHYEGEQKDFAKLPKYVSGGSTCFMVDTGKYYRFDEKTKTWIEPESVKSRFVHADEVYAILNNKIKDVGGVNPEDVNNAVQDYLTKNPVQPTPIDSTLTKTGEAADAKVVGDKVTALKESFVNLKSKTTLEVNSVNIYNPFEVELDKSVQASGLVTENTGYAYIEIAIPFKHAVVFTSTLIDGKRGITTKDKKGTIIKSLCVKELNGKVLEDEGSNSQIAIYWNKLSDSVKKIYASWRYDSVEELMIEVVPIKQHEGKDDEFATYMSAEGMTKYIHYSQDYFLRGAKLENKSVSRDKLTSWYYGKKICTFGDSITEHETWQGHLVDYFGCTFQNCGVGGTTVALSTQPAYQKNCMYQDARIDAIDKDSDVIIVWGGNNDFGATYEGIELGDIVPFWTLSDDGDSIHQIKVNNFAYAYALMLKKLITRFPTAKIFTMTCMCGRTSDGNINEDSPFFMNNLSMRDFSNMIKKVSGHYGIPCIDVGGLSGISTLNHQTYFKKNDVIHPNAEGGKLIAKTVISELERFEPIDFEKNYEPKY